MKPRSLLLSALVAALYPDYASAIGFGQIILHSRVGEALRAEVPIHVTAGEPIDTACFSLAALPGSDLPVVTNARIRLSRNGSDARLSIVGTRPLAEPVFIVALRANCGVEFQRDYVLMPAPPVALATAESVGDAPASVAAPATRKASRNFLDYRAREGETLASIAESRSQGSPEAQQRLLAALERANPNLVADQALAGDTAVRVPVQPRQAASLNRPEAPTARQRSPDDQARAAVQRPKPAPVAASEAPPAGSGDRLLLAPPPEEARTSDKAVGRLPTAREMEERMLKLETTLSLLSQEMEKLDAALNLTTQVIDAQQKLRTAQSLQTPAERKGITAGSAVAESERSSHSNWTELLTSALIGGGVAVGMAHLLARRNRRPDDELPLAVNGYRHEVHPAPPGASPNAETGSVTPAAPASAAPPAAVDIPLDGAAEGNPGNLAANYDDGNSALELAEIMLSFGRLSGATETLARHIEVNTPDNIQPWAMLLDLYRRGNMPTEFATLAAMMRQRFNVHVPAWNESETPVSGLKSLEDYAHIVWRITQCWGTQECMNYLFSLVHDNRAGTRSGFPLEVVEEIALLMLTLEEAYGSKRPD